jgi:hypothetical protein
VKRLVADRLYRGSSAKTSSVKQSALRIPLFRSFAGSLCVINNDPLWGTSVLRPRSRDFVALWRNGTAFIITIPILNPRHISCHRFNYAGPNRVRERGAIRFDGELQAR